LPSWAFWCLGRIHADGLRRRFHTTTGALAGTGRDRRVRDGGTALKAAGTVLGVLFGSLIMASFAQRHESAGSFPGSQIHRGGAVLALAVWMDVRLGRK